MEHGQEIWGMHLLGQILNGTYRLDRLIGKGGMGAVYEAYHLRVEKRYALKVLLPSYADEPDAIARFQREAKIASAMGHPHIVDVIDFNQIHDGSFYFVMEYLNGEDLHRRLKRVKNLPLHQAAGIFFQVASALKAAHKQNIIHRDLKPHNIILCRQGSQEDFVKLVDFGISKIIGAQGPHTQTHAILGTPQYMSPEQVEFGASVVDHRSDIYGLGIILYEMLSGIPSVTGDSPLNLFYRIIHQVPTPLREIQPDLPEKIVKVISKAMQKKPQHRFNSIVDFRRAFFLAMEEEGFSASSEPYDEGAITFSAKQDPRTLASKESIKVDIKLESLHDNNAMTFPSSAEIVEEANNTAQNSTLSVGTGELPQSDKGVNASVKKYYLWAAVLVGLVVLGGGAFYREVFFEEKKTTGTPIMLSSPSSLHLGEATHDIKKSSLAVLNNGPHDGALSDVLAATQNNQKAQPPPIVAKPDSVAKAINGGNEAFPENKTSKRPKVKPLEMGIGSLAVQALSEGQAIAPEIYLDGQLLGQSPLRLKDVEAGPHLLEARLAGYEIVKKSLRIEAGKKLRVSLELKKLQK